jgi:CHRD domain
MKSLIAKFVLAIAVVALAGCAGVREKMPAWMPGSGAIKVNLSGAEEVPPVTAQGSGSGSFRVSEDGTLSGSVTTKDVEGTMAHIHRAAKGQNGPIIVPLDKKGDTYSVPAGRKLTPQQMDDLKAGNLYVNVHTNRNKGGEVRGQLQP